MANNSEERHNSEFMLPPKIKISLRCEIQVKENILSEKGARCDLRSILLVVSYEFNIGTMYFYVLQCKHPSICVS